MWRKLKQWLARLAIGAFVGFGLWSLVGRSLTSMWFGSLGGTFSCREDVEVALGRYIGGQLYSAVGGAIALPLGHFLIRRWFAKRRARRLPAPLDPGSAESPDSAEEKQRSAGAGTP